MYKPIHMCIDIPAGVFSLENVWVDVYPIKSTDIVQLTTFFEFGETYPIYYCVAEEKYVASPDLFCNMSKKTPYKHSQAGSHRGKQFW